MSSASETKRPKLFLIDGPNLAFRAFFAIRGMVNSNGLPTNALFGFTNMLLKLIRDEKPDFMAVTWDPKGGSFRERLYPEYKGTRPEMPEALREQMPHFRRLVESFGIPYLCLDDLEADDVMGTLARRWQESLDVILVSSDKDLMQLLGDHVTMLDTMKDQRITPTEVMEKFGCAPHLVPDALGIWGDSSDNIPGVKGIGEKGVKALLARFDGLEAVYDHIDEVAPPGTRKKLIEHRENAFLSRTLATIKTDAEVEVELADLAFSYPPPEERMRELFTELEFRSLLRELGGSMTAVDRSRYRLVTTKEELAELRQCLESAERFAFDTETTSLDELSADLVGLSFCCDDAVAWYVPVAHQDPGPFPQLSWEEVRTALGPVLESPSVGKTAQNLKFDLKVLHRHGVELRGIDGDTLILDYILNPDRRSHGIDDLALLHLNHRMLSFKETVAEGSTFASVPLERARDYAAEDAHVAWLLDRRLSGQLSELGLDHLYRDLELPLVEVLARMEERGIGLDLDVLANLDTELTQRISQSEKACYDLAGAEFNIGSVKQLREVLFDHLGLPVIRKTKTGPSTNESVLSELAQHHPLPRAILDHRSLVKLKSTYVVPLPSLVNPRTGRIHTHFSQTTAATGRLASTEPNLQNIPIRTDEGRRIRQAFVAPPGSLFLSADYSQVELRVLAHLCGGSGGFARAFEAGADVHTETAAGLFGVEPDQVTRQQRSIAKAVNFGIVYGQSAFGLSQSQGISRREAADYIDRYNERFPEIEEFRLETLERARANGYVETLLGRRRPVPDLSSGTFAQRSQAERIAVNTPVQGSAADLIKKAMIAVDRRLRTEHPGQHLLLQVHDELLLEVAESKADAVASMVRQEMCSALELKVPLVVEIGVGRTWDDAH